MKLVKFASLITIFTMCSFVAHKYYMSVTHIKHVPKQKAVQITQRIFIDDLQLELNTLNNTSIELATDREPQNIDSIYKNYLRSHFTVEINNRPNNYNYIGKEYNDDMVVFYLEIINIKEIKTIKAVNNLLYYSFFDQENIVKLNINEQEKSFILTKNKTEAFIEY